MFGEFDFEIYTDSFDWQSNTSKNNLEFWMKQEEQIKLFSHILTTSNQDIGAHKTLTGKGRSYNLGVLSYYNYAYYGLGMNNERLIVLPFDRDETPGVYKNDVRIAYSVSGGTPETLNDVMAAWKKGAIVGCVTASPHKEIANVSKGSWIDWVDRSKYAWDKETYPIVTVLGRRDVSTETYSQRQVFGEGVEASALGTAGEIGSLGFNGGLSNAQAEQYRNEKEEISLDGFSRYRRSVLDDLEKFRKSRSLKKCMPEIFDNINNTQVIFSVGRGISEPIRRSFTMRMLHLGNDGRERPELHGEYNHRFAWGIDDPGFSFKYYKERTGIEDGVCLGITVGNDESNLDTMVSINLARKAKEAGYKVISITSNPKGGIVNYSDIVLEVPSKTYPLLSHDGESYYGLKTAYEVIMIALDSLVPPIQVSRRWGEKKMSEIHK